MRACTSSSARSPFLFKRFVTTPRPSEALRQVARPRDAARLMVDREPAAAAAAALRRETLATKGGEQTAAGVVRPRRDVRGRPSLPLEPRLPEIRRRDPV